MNPPYDTIRFRREKHIGTIQFYRPDAGNTIVETTIAECRHVLDTHGETLTVVVLEGLPEVFLFGADFGDIHRRGAAGTSPAGEGAAALYELWLDLATGPYVTIAHVRGRANAGGVGFVAACDIVLADESATFSLSELLFGLYPACVLPFLIRRIGLQKAHYLTLMTQPVSVHQAERWGLVDAVGANSGDLLRRHLLRLRRLSKKGVGRYKQYMAELDDFLVAARNRAVAENRALFSDPDNLASIARFVETGRFPWDKS